MTDNEDLPRTAGCANSYATSTRKGKAWGWECDRCGENDSGYISEYAAGQAAAEHLAATT